MLDPMLRNIRERLLRQGIAPRHVNRYVGELRDHLADLVGREAGNGLDHQTACSRALSLLGTEPQLVQAMLDRRPPRSLAAKAPWLALGVLPIVLMLPLTILLGRLAMAWFDPYRDIALADLPENIRSLSLAVTALGSYGIGLVLVLGCVIVAVRQRLNSTWMWVGLGLLALACGAIGLHVDLLTTVNGTAGGIRGSFVQTVLSNGSINVPATVVLIVARALGLILVAAVAYRVLRQRLEQSPG